MITLNASGGSVTFEFSGNSTYLNDGTITVPVNSLALIIDESDMATFRKAASNDIFVSANIAEFGMTKAELESWYKANMVGSTGGGGGGVTPSEVQTMIDESISGKADSSDVYTTGQTSGATEIANALNEKLDATAYTVDASINIASTNPVQNKALYNELRVENETTLTFSDNIATNYPNGCTEIKVDASASDTMASITFYDSNWQQLGGGQITIDTLHGNIAVENNFEGSTYTINGNIVTISYPSITNVKYLFAVGSDYTYKAVTSVSTLKDVVNGKTNQSDFTAYTADTTPKVDAAWQKGVIAPSLGYDTISGITLSSLPISGGDYNYSSIATDASIGVNNGVLGVYTTGDTHVVSINPTERINTAYLGVDKKPFNIKMYWNSSYTGNTSHNIAVNCVVNDGTNGYCQWNWNGSQYTPRSDYNNTAVTLSYDSTNQVVTITPSSSSALDYIKYVKCNRYIAPSSSLTQEDCRIGLVTIDTNSYKLQEALDNKQDTLSAGTGISISGNVISATGGGGKAIEAGRGISVTTGATADTVSISLPISAGTGTNAVVIGQYNNATGNTSYAEGSYTLSYNRNSHAEGLNTNALGMESHAEGFHTTAATEASHAEGRYTKASGDYSHAEGNFTIASNSCEHASGQYNVSNKASNTFGDSGNTLFSVGNGEDSEYRHNAFEIRQNGDIYFEYDGSDVKLQDKLDEIETVTAAALNNLNDRVSEDEEVTAAALNNLNDRFGGLSLVKLTQTEYDNLQTKDSNTLYVIVN